MRSAPGLSGYEIERNFTIVEPPGGALTVECPAGKSVLGGGTLMTPPGEVHVSRPTAPTFGEPAYGWRASATNPGSGVGLFLEVFAICATTT